MTETQSPEARDGLRGLVGRWKKTALVIGAIVVSEVGRRVEVLGIDERILGDFLRHGGGNPLIRIYDLIVGGALSRGAILALGVVPYVSARIWMRIGRAVIPALGEMWTHESGRTRIQRWTRRLTFGLSAAQSFSYARLVQSAPGAVAHPGVGFTIQTMVVLTTATMVAMLIGEQIMPYPDVDAVAPVDDTNAAPRETGPPTPRDEPVAATTTNGQPELLLDAGPIEPVRLDEARRSAEPVYRRGV